MSLRKIVGLLAGFALAVGLIGAGVGAQFTDSVTAQQNIHVGTFSCDITSANGNVSGKTLTYNAPPITSSAAGNSAFTFTVTNTGTISAALQISETALAAPFSSMLTMPVAPVVLAGGNATTYNAGIQWAALSNANRGESVSITYTVNCGEVGTPTVTFYSTDRGSYGGQDSVRFAGSGTGMTPGDTIDVSYSWKVPDCSTFSPACPWDLSTYWSAVGETAPKADANGNFTYWFADNCHDGQNYITDQTAVVTATDGHGHTATGTGILACSLMAP